MPATTEDIEGMSSEAKDRTASNQQARRIAQLRDVIDNLYSLMIQSFYYQGPQSGNAMINEIKRLITNLTTLTTTSRSLPTTVPFELIEYVEAGRNPDIYNRDWVEKVQRDNQDLKGKSEAFGNFRDVFAQAIEEGLPELKREVGRVLGENGTVSQTNGIKQEGVKGENGQV